MVMTIAPGAHLKVGAGPERWSNGDAEATVSGRERVGGSAGMGTEAESTGRHGGPPPSTKRDSESVRLGGAALLATLAPATAAPASRQPIQINDFRASRGARPCPSPKDTSAASRRPYHGPSRPVFTPSERQAREIEEIVRAGSALDGHGVVIGQQIQLSDKRDVAGRIATARGPQTQGARASITASDAEALAKIGVRLETGSPDFAQHAVI